MTKPTAHDAGAPAPAEMQASSKTVLGFWIYLMSDAILFAALFATYAVLHGNVFGGPSGGDLFDLPYALTETLVLLTSSFVCGLAVLAARHGNKTRALLWLGLTFALGAMFVTLELHEFSIMVHEGNSWERSAFLSSFFTLVGTHGLHVTAGLVWAAVLLVRIVRGGVAAHSQGVRLFSMFWHFLDIIWIFIFTIVYLMGAAS
jgi:cytochrome o ubiquinol oxidase subunit 3